MISRCRAWKRVEIGAKEREEGHGSRSGGARRLGEGFEAVDGEEKWRRWSELVGIAIQRVRIGAELSFLLL